jgi:hypothetical protein
VSELNDGVVYFFYFLFKDWDDYDILVRNLRKETLHNPTNRLKTPEERAKEELKYLEALEQGRLRRMKGIRW